jgi:hypothetical protein
VPGRRDHRHHGRGKIVIRWQEQVLDRMLSKEHRRSMRITACFEEGSVESLERIGVHSPDELVGVATTSNDRPIIDVATVYVTHDAILSGDQQIGDSDIP